MPSLCNNRALVMLLLLSASLLLLPPLLLFDDARPALEAFGESAEALCLLRQRVGVRVVFEDDVDILLHDVPDAVNLRLDHDDLISVERALDLGRLTQGGALPFRRRRHGRRCGRGAADLLLLQPAKASAQLPRDASRTRGGGAR